MILEFSGVRLNNKLRGKPPILDGVSFRQPQGVSIGIIGARGSGKSVLIQLANGSLAPDGGKVRRFGRVSMPIGFPATLHQKLTGEEITRITAGLFDLNPDALCRFVAEVSELGDAFYSPLSLYNATKRSRFVFSLSYAIPADCYIADGALFGGQGSFRDTCLELARQRKSEAAFLFTSTSPRDMRMFADVGGVLEEGRLTIFPSVEDAIARYESTLD